MNSERFDRFSRALAMGASRRQVFAALAGGIMSTVAAARLPMPAKARDLPKPPDGALPDRIATVWQGIIISFPADHRFVPLQPSPSGDPFEPRVSAAITPSCPPATDCPTVSLDLYPTGSLSFAQWLDAYIDRISDARDLRRVTAGKHNGRRFITGDPSVYPGASVIYVFRIGANAFVVRAPEGHDDLNDFFENLVLDPSSIPFGLTPEEIGGTWTGVGVQVDPSSEWAVNIAITGGEHSGVIGASSYPALGCEGTLTFVYALSGIPRRVVLFESIESGKDICADGTFDVIAAGHHEQATSLTFIWTSTKSAAIATGALYPTSD